MQQSRNHLDAFVGIQQSIDRQYRQLPYESRQQTDRYDNQPHNDRIADKSEPGIASGRENTGDSQIGHAPACRIIGADKQHNRQITRGLRRQSRPLQCQRTYRDNQQAGSNANCRHQYTEPIAHNLRLIESIAAKQITDKNAARIAKADVRTPALFDVMQREGGISEHDMFNTFNMGVGMVLTVAPEDADKALEILKAHGEDAYRLGTIVEGDGVVLV